MNYAVRITTPYDAYQKILSLWALKVGKLVVYEHVGDKTEKTHVHLLIMESSVDAERLKQIAKENGSVPSGNKFWSFKTKHKHHGPLTKETMDRYVTYMSKGIHEPKYYTGVTPEYLAERKAAWVKYEKALSKDREIYDKFVGFVGRENLTNSETLRQQATRYAFDSYGVINRAALTMAGMLFRTHCYIEGWSLEKDRKFNEL